MATLKQRLHRKNGSGGYDVVHLETEASMVLMANGKTVETEVNGKAASNHNHDSTYSKTDHTHTQYAAATHNHDTVYSKTNHTHTQYAASSHTHPSSQISDTVSVTKGGTGRTSVTAGSFLRGNGTGAMTETTLEALKKELGVGAGTGSSFAINSSGVGTYVKWANRSWIIVHKESNKLYLAMTEIYNASVQFGNNNTYNGSNLAAVAKTFEDSLPADSLAIAVNTTVHGVTSKIFVPTSAQVNGGFLFFSSNSNRLCGIRGSTGSHVWWTSSYDGIDGASYVIIVNTGGMTNGQHVSTNFNGFRPFVAIGI